MFLKIRTRDRKDNETDSEVLKRKSEGIHPRGNLRDSPDLLRKSEGKLFAVGERAET